MMRSLTPLSTLLAVVALTLAGAPSATAAPPISTAAPVSTVAVSTVTSSTVKVSYVVSDLGNLGDATSGPSIAAGVNNPWRGGRHDPAGGRFRAGVSLGSGNRKDERPRDARSTQLPGAGVNGRGQIVGNAEAQTFDSHAFRWDPSPRKMVDLGVLPGTVVSAASDINDRGQIVGTASDVGDNTSRAFLFDPRARAMRDDRSPLSSHPAVHKHVVRIAGMTAADARSPRR